MGRRTDVIGVAMYLVAAFLFALNGVIAKAALNAGFDPVHLTQLRNAGAMVANVFRPLSNHPPSTSTAVVSGRPPPAGLPSPSSVAIVLLSAPSSTAPRHISANHSGG